MKKIMALDKHAFKTGSSEKKKPFRDEIKKNQEN